MDFSIFHPARHSPGPPQQRILLVNGTYVREHWTMNEITFQGQDLRDLQENVKEAVLCHFEEAEAPRAIRLETGGRTA